VDLQTFLFDLTDMHRPNHKMEEDMEFKKGLSVKQILEICCPKKLIMVS
jgi:hypothetical protein